MSVLLVIITFAPSGGGRHRSVISDVILPTFSGAEERTQGRDKRDKLPPPLPLLLLLLLLSDCMVR